jgi:predicted regulator of Ras-like GTPase activity (Roadblock/LC7/MglB family)
MGGYAISEQQSIALNDAIASLSTQAEAQATFLSDSMGNIIAHAADYEDGKTQTMAALAAGSFAATRELAALVGEPAFHSILHKGAKSSIFIQSITTDFILLVVFGQDTTPGLVKLYADKACKQLHSTVLEMSTQSTVNVSDGKTTFEMDADAQLFGSGEKDGS